MTFKTDLVAALTALPGPTKLRLIALKPRLGVENPGLPDVADYMIRNLKADVDQEERAVLTNPPLDMGA